MAPLPKSSIDHFTHSHPLTPSHTDLEFSCDGCKTIGTGKRFRCNGCDFDLHDYCGTCPKTLPSFMHPHSLTLVVRKPAGSRTGQTDRVCDMCRESVEGLFYRCKECEFDVHPLCTQLPEKLNHALHKVHPLILQSTPTAGFCGVCRRSCGGWRYRCVICSFDMHIECVLKPVVEYPQNGGTDRGIPFQGPPFYEYPYHVPEYPNFGPGANMYHGGPYGPHMYPSGNFAPQNYQTGVSSDNGTGRDGNSMFSLVTKLGFGVVSNMIFGVDVSPVFGG